MFTEKFDMEKDGHILAKYLSRIICVLLQKLKTKLKGFSSSQEDLSRLSAKVLKKHHVLDLFRLLRFV